MANTLADFIQDNSSGLFIPPQARRQVIPYDDLRALATPTQLPQISPDLLSALAIMVAQGPDRPRLVSVDDRGALVTEARLNTVTRLTAPLVANATVAMVRDTSGFFPGDHVALITNGNPSSDCVDVVVKSVDSPTQLTFVATCSSVGFAVGDFVVGEQVVNIRQHFEPVPIGGQSVLTAVGFAGTPDDRIMMTTTIKGHRRFAVDNVRSIDFNSSVQQIQPAAATINVPSFGVGFRAVIDWFEFSILNNSGAATGPVAQVWDGAIGVGTIKWNSTMLCPATQSTATIFRNDMRLKGSDNTAMNLAFSVGGANIFESISVGGYVEG